MIRVTRKVICLFLIFVMLVQLFPAYEVSAAGVGRAIRILDNHDVIMEVTSTKATSGIRYRTAGWTITAKPSCSTQGGVYDCKPRQIGYVPLDKVPSVDVEDPTGTYIIATYRYPGEQVKEQFFGKFYEEYAPNQTIYFSAVMESYDANTGQRRKGPFTTFQEIRNAEPWAHPEDLREFFDIPVPYNPLNPVIEQLYVVNDGVRTLVQTKEIGEYAAYAQFGHSLPEKITYQGRELSISRSYLADAQRPNVERFVQSVANGDPRVVDRTVSVAYGGTLVVAEYEASIPTMARFIREDDKSELEAPESIGPVSFGGNLQYDFTPKEFLTKTIGGVQQTFRLVKSYVQIDGGPPQFVQELGSPSLLRRNVTYVTKPTDIVGEYRLVENPVTVIAKTESGTELLREELGEFPTGSAVSHTFDSNISRSGTTYEIIESHIIANRNPTAKQYIQRVGDANLLNRNITVASGGNQIVGIYRSGESETEQPPGTCVVTISPPQKGQIRNGSVMDPAASGMLRADNRGAELFNVQQGIPTSENLFANVFALSYLYQNQFANMTGEVTYKVDVKKTYLKTWTVTSEDPEVPPLPMSKTEVVQEQVTIKRPYSYWQIDNLEVYGIDRSTVSNYALGGQGGTITLQPNSYSAPVLQSSHRSSVNDHVTPAPCDAIDLGVQELPGGDQELPTPSLAAEAQAEAEKAIGKNKVRNDRLLFNGATIMNDGTYDETAPAPGVIPAPTQIGQDVLYRNGMTISRTLQNRADNPTTGQIYYELLPGNINGGADRSFAIPNMNTVTVHTPTVMYPAISDDREHNQKINPAAGRAALILDREFTVSIPTSGQHRNIPGYGNRDYQKYITIKQIYFPFDVYDSETGHFYEKNQWISIPVPQQSKTFFLPVWVDEGFYTVSFRSFAENYPPGFTHETAANMNWMNHVATNTVPVDVVGRLYDFRITDIADVYWETVFRTKKGSVEHTPNVYYVGNRDIDGQVVGNRNMQGQQVGGNKLLTLPIRPGSHTDPAYKSWAIKTGYHFKFEVKTKGNMDGTRDAVRIYPTFYFVKKDGTGRQPVDLYYHDYTNKKYFIKIGSDRDKLTRTVQLDNKYRNIPQGVMNDTVNFMARQYGINNFLELAKRKTNVGTFSWMIHPYTTRTVNGPKAIPSSVDANRALGSMQTWYGEYSIPAAAYVVPAGTDLAQWAVKEGGGALTDKSKIFLKDGYIIVNFQIETIRNQDLQNPYLRYYPLDGQSTPYNNQWLMEGFQRVVQDAKSNTFRLRDGDVAFYHADVSSNDDIGVGVTH